MKHFWAAVLGVVAAAAPALSGAAEARVALESPRDQEEVNPEITVVGKVTGAASNSSLWLFVNPSGDAGWFPQQRLRPAPNGSIRGLAYLGGENGRVHYVAIVEANTKATAEIERALPAAQKGVADDLPAGARVLKIVSLKKRDVGPGAWLRAHSSVLSVLVALLALGVSAFEYRARRKDRRDLQRRVGRLEAKVIDGREAAPPSLPSEVPRPRSGRGPS